MYYKDLSKYNHDLPYFLEEVLCVGWLKENIYFERKISSPDFIHKFEQILCGNSSVNTVVNQMRGFHQCDICGEYKPSISCNNIQGFKLLGSSEIWIPAANKEVYFASPSLIIHYIIKHDYAPPKEFLDAVLSFDLTKKFDGQEIYEDLIRQNNPNIRDK